MAVSTAAVLKTVAQVADAFNNAGKKDDGNNSGILIKIIVGVIGALLLIVAAIVSIITSPTKWADPQLQQFKQNYSYIVPSSNPAGTGDTSKDYSSLVQNLNVSEQRKAVVSTALSLEGRVSYFWGGKSSAIGWDNRWGKYYTVTAAGSPSTGTKRPYGLDCSGYVDWVFNNALGYVIGHGGGALIQCNYCTEITWTEAQPGDLAFYPGCEHVGIVVDNDGGTLSIINCASGANNVVISKQSGPSHSGFLTVGCPKIYLQGGA